jgi:uncharacterized membrane protein
MKAHYLAIFMLQFSCKGETETGISVEPDSGGWEGMPCDSVPSVTWENWGRAFFTTHCQGCHASTAPDRYGATNGVYFDTLSDLRTWNERVRVRVLDQNDMPPAGGLSEDERFLLQVLLDCGIQ